METFALIMYALAFVCFLLGAFGSPRVPNSTVNPTALGLALAITPTLVAAIGSVT